ncbi:MAG TPA: GlxA family transcriptional regulator [Steroidobacteraceae bacterium]|nr:GlxA family transcriptional regulator [Steroidobacteraceae bacterium]
MKPRSSRSSSAGKGRKPRLALGFVLADHFTLSSFAVFTDLMRLAADEGDFSRQVQITWSVMSSRPQTPASCGIAVTRSSEFVDPQRFDYVIVVGGVMHKGPQIDAATEEYLHRAARAGVPLIGMCTGSFILCRIGLMQDRCSCVSWYHYQDFLDEFPDHAVVADRIFLVDRDRITLPGGAGAADLALHLIKRHLGRAVAQKAQEVLQFDRMRLGNEPPPHPPLTAAVAHPVVRRALLLMEQHMARPLTIAELANHLEISTRQFERLCRDTLGQSPAAVYRSVRLRYAGWLLSHSRQSVTQIALSAGFADGPHFSRLFRRTYGFPPSQRREDGAGQRIERAAVRIFS